MFVGALVGLAGVDDGDSCEVKNCYSKNITNEPNDEARLNEKTDIQEGGNVDLGIYGQSSGVNIEGISNVKNEQ